MLNRIELIGRLTRDPEVPYVSGGHPLGVLSCTGGTPQIVFQSPTCWGSGSLAQLSVRVPQKIVVEPACITWARRLVTVVSRKRTVAASRNARSASR